MSIRIWPVVPALLGPQVRHNPELPRKCNYPSKQEPLSLLEKKNLSTPSKRAISTYLVGPDRAKARQMIINREGRRSRILHHRCSEARILIQRPLQARNIPGYRPECETNVEACRKDRTDAITDMRKEPLART